jgi:hypothetical protein
MDDDEISSSMCEILLKLQDSLEEMTGKSENLIEENEYRIIEKMLMARPDIHPICKI